MYEIFGLIATIVFGVLSIWFYIRKRRPCGIRFFAIDSINVYSNLSLDFDNLEIQANGKKIDSDLLFFSGVFVCDGHSDIKGSDHKLTLELPCKCKWNDIKISSKSQDLDATVTINHEKQETAWLFFDQFRMKEFITIKALIECNNQKLLSQLHNFHTNIKFFHRIEDTDNVRIGVAIRRQVNVLVHFILQIPFVVMALMTSLLLFVVVGSSPLTYIDKDSKVMYRAHVNPNNNVSLHNYSSIKSFFSLSEKEVSPKDFREKYIVMIKYNRYSLVNLSLIIICILTLCFLIVLLVRRNLNYFRNRRLLNMYFGEGL